MSSILTEIQRRPKVRAEKLKTFIANNQEEQCGVKGCTSSRNRASIYCKKHQRLYTEMGHPLMVSPTPKVIRAVEKVILQWLDSLPEKEKDQLGRTWGAGVVKLKRHPRYAVPFSTLEGVSGYTQKSKADVFLAHYQKQGHSLSNVMLRWMSYRLYAELHYWAPPAKKSKATELTKWVNLHTGKYVTCRANFNNSYNIKEVVGVRRKWWKNSAEPDADETLYETKTINVWKKYGMAGIRRVIGSNAKSAIESAVGVGWLSLPNLQSSAQAAILSLSESS